MRGIPMAEQSCPRAADAALNGRVLQSPREFWDSSRSVQQSPPMTASNGSFGVRTPYSSSTIDPQSDGSNHPGGFSNPFSDPLWTFGQEAPDDLFWSNLIDGLSTRQEDSRSREPRRRKQERPGQRQENGVFQDSGRRPRTKGNSKLSKAKSTAPEPPEVLRATIAASGKVKELDPLWLSDWQDDFGASGSRLGYRPGEMPEGNIQENAACLPDITFEPSASLSGFEITNGLESTTIEPDNLLLEFDPAVFAYVPLPYDSEPSGDGQISHASTEFSNYKECPLPSLEMTRDSSQLTFDSQTMLEVSDEDSVPLSSDSSNEKAPQASSTPLQSESQGGFCVENGAAKSARGRHGPLSKDCALRVAKTRKEKTICIWCRIRRVSCDGGVPCTRCTLVSKTKLIEQPCLRAHFAGIVFEGSCNYFSPRQINPLTLDGARRISKTIPEELDFPKLLSFTGRQHQNFNIGASRDFQSSRLWTLDLSQLHKFLLKLQRNFKVSDRTNFRGFLDSVLPMASGWEVCVKDLEDEDLLAVLHRWNTMPSHVSFSLLPRAHDSAPQPLDVEDPAQMEDVIAAAQLSRIVCRALETSAFNTLQKRLNKPSTYQSENDLRHLLYQIGEVLLQFRWRISWWDLSSYDGCATETQCKQRYIARLKQLTRVLYFYYCAALARLPSFSSKDDLKGIQRFDGGKATFFEYFPHDNSITGWESWMALGLTLVAEARRVKTVQRDDPYPKVELRSIVGRADTRG